MKKFTRGVVMALTLLFTLTLINCQQEDDSQLNPNLQQEINQDSKVTSKSVNAADIPDIIDFVKSKSSPSLTFKFNETNYAAAPGGGETINHENNLTISQVMSEEIEMVTENNLSNYAFDVETNSNDYFLNLIVSEYGNTEFMYFIKYVADLNASELGLFGFTGTMYYYSETGVFKMSSTVENGVVNDNCPCDGDDGGGGGEDCNEAIKWLCDWRGNFHDNRADCSCDPGIEPGCGGTYVITNPPGCGGNTSVNPYINSTTSTSTCPCGYDDSDNPVDGEEGTGGGGGTPINNCPGATPCAELKEYDENCNCVSATPIGLIPINEAKVSAAKKELKDCVGMDYEGFWEDDSNLEAVLYLGDYISKNGCSSETQVKIIEIIEGVADNILKPHCSSFEYAMPPGALTRACAVINLNVSFFAYGYEDGQFGTFSVDINHPLIYFTMPSYFTNGNAATTTAIAVNDAFDEVENWFEIHPNATEAEVSVIYDAALTSNLAIFGGTWTLTPPFNIPSPAPYVSSLFTTGNCN